MSRKAESIGNRTWVGSKVLCGIILAIAMPVSVATAQDGTEGDPANQDIPSIPHESHLGPGSLDITAVTNCCTWGS